MLLSLKQGLAQTLFDKKASESNFAEALKALDYRGGYNLDALIQKLKSTPYKFERATEKDIRYNELKSILFPVLEEVKGNPEAARLLESLLNQPAK